MDSEKTTWKETVVMAEKMVTGKVVVRVVEAMAELKTPRGMKSSSMSTQLTKILAGKKPKEVRQFNFLSTLVCLNEKVSH